MTVEKLLGTEIPKRVQYLRVIIMELARITDHVVCNAVIGVDTGALTGFVYMFQQRELVYEIYEEICGARLTTKYWSHRRIRARLFTKGLGQDRKLP